MTQFLFSKRYFHPQELNKCKVLKAVVVIASRFKTILNTVLHTLTLKTFIQKSNFKISNRFNLLSSIEQDYSLLALYKHTTKKKIYCLQEPTVQAQNTESLQHHHHQPLLAHARFSMQAPEKIIRIICDATPYVWHCICMGWAPHPHFLILNQLTGSSHI